MVQGIRLTFYDFYILLWYLRLILSVYFRVFQGLYENKQACKNTLLQFQNSKVVLTRRCVRMSYTRNQGVELTHIVNRGNLSVLRLNWSFYQQKKHCWSGKVTLIVVRNSPVNSPSFILCLSYSWQKALRSGCGCTPQELLKRNCRRRCLAQRYYGRALLIVEISFCRIGFSVQVFDTLAAVWWRNCGVWHELRGIVKYMSQQMALIWPYFLRCWKTEHYAIEWVIYLLCVYLNYVSDVKRYAKKRVQSDLLRLVSLMSIMNLGKSPDDSVSLGSGEKRVTTGANATLTRRNELQRCAYLPERKDRWVLYGHIQPQLYGILLYEMSWSCVQEWWTGWAKVLQVLPASILCVC